jgi:hypothetical protein
MSKEFPFKKIGEIHHHEHGHAGDMYQHTKTGKYHPEGAAGDGPTEEGHDSPEHAMKAVRRDSIPFLQRESDMSRKHAMKHVEGLHFVHDKDQMKKAERAPAVDLLIDHAKHQNELKWKKEKQAKKDKLDQNDRVSDIMAGKSWVPFPNHKRGQNRKPGLKKGEKTEAGTHTKLDSDWHVMHDTHGMTDDPGKHHLIGPSHESVHDTHKEAVEHWKKNLAKSMKKSEHPAFLENKGKIRDIMRKDDMGASVGADMAMSEKFVSNKPYRKAHFDGEPVHNVSVYKQDDGSHTAHVFHATEIDHKTKGNKVMGSSSGHKTAEEAFKAGQKIARGEPMKKSDHPHSPFGENVDHRTPMQKNRGKHWTSAYVHKDTEQIHTHHFGTAHEAAEHSYQMKKQGHKAEVLTPDQDE